ncbi:RpiR family transcriptional regulator [Niallia nealsonii AAU1]|nr:RpiR family transcriptional regulator [Niallia nealsonii AAU1]
MNILDQILSIYRIFSPTEIKIADYILEHKMHIASFTIAELAEKSEVSEASITRFCQKIEVGGFHQLKIKLAKLVSQEEVLKERIGETPLQQQLDRIKENKLEEISQTIHLIDEDNLTIALERFKKSKRVLFLAFGNTIPVALDAAYRFNQIGIFSIAFSIWDTNLTALMNFNKNDLVVVISNSGETKELIKSIEWCRQNEIFVIGMTNHYKSPIALLSNIHLITATRERIFQQDYYFSRISAMLLIETLFLLLSFENDLRLDKIRKHEELISDSKI